MTSNRAWKTTPTLPDAAIPGLCLPRASHTWIKGVLAGPGTPRDPKSHLFVTKWVAVAPFGTWGPARGQNFVANLARGGSRPLNLNFFPHHFGATKCKNVVFV